MRIVWGTMVNLNGLTRLPPRFLIPLVTKLIQFAYALLAWLIPPPLRAVQLAFEGRALSEVMRTACALDIAEALASGPQTAKQLSMTIGALLVVACQVHLIHVVRLLRSPSGQ